MRHLVHLSHGLIDLLSGGCNRPAFQLPLTPPLTPGGRRHGVNNVVHEVTRPARPPVSPAPRQDQAIHKCQCNPEYTHESFHLRLAIESGLQAFAGKLPTLAPEPRGVTLGGAANYIHMETPCIHTLIPGRAAGSLAPLPQ